MCENKVCLQVTNLKTVSQRVADTVEEAGIFHSFMPFYAVPQERLIQHFYLIKQIGVKWDKRS